MSDEIVFLNHERITADSDKNVQTVMFARLGMTHRITSDPEKDTILTVTRGTVEIFSDDGRFRVEQGDVFFLKKGGEQINITSKFNIELPASEDKRTSIVLVT